MNFKKNVSKMVTENLSFLSEFKSMKNSLSISYLINHNLRVNETNNGRTSKIINVNLRKYKLFYRCLSLINNIER